MTPADVDAAQQALAPWLRPSPCIRSAPLEAVLGCSVHLKCELFQPTGSFKPRGVLNWLANATDGELQRGLVAVSAGNHGMALAWAAGARGVPVTVVMPEASSAYKVDACRGFGAEVILHGDIHETWTYAWGLVAARGATLVPPYDDSRIIAGQGSIGLELVAQVPDLATVLCPVGGGGLVSGIALAIKSHRPSARVIGVEPAGAATLKTAWDTGAPVDVTDIRTIAASLGANRAGELTYEVSHSVVDELVLVSDDSIRAAGHALITEGKLYAEPGAVLGLAALMDDAVTLSPEAPAAAVVTGGNLDWDTLNRLLA